MSFYGQIRKLLQGMPMNTDNPAIIVMDFYRDHLPCQLVDITVTEDSLLFVRKLLNRRLDILAGLYQFCYFAM